MTEDLELMHGLADGRLEGAEKERAEELLRTDKACAAEYKWAQAMKGAMADKCRMDVDDTAWKASVARFDELDKVGKIEGFVGKYAWALCGLVLAGILFGAVNERMFGRQVLSEAQVANIFNPVSFNKSSGFDAEKAQYLDLNGYSIRDQRFGQFDGRDSVYYNVQDQFGGLVLIGMEGEMNLEGMKRSSAAKGFYTGRVNNANCVTWKMNDVTFILASNRTDRELVDIAKSMLR